jgi:hypothetical protein
MLQEPCARRGVSPQIRWLAAEQRSRCPVARLNEHHFRPHHRDARLFKQFGGDVLHLFLQPTEPRFYLQDGKLKPEHEQIESLRVLIAVGQFARQGYTPPPPPRKPRPLETLWCMRKDGRQTDCGLLGHGEHGWEVQDGDWFYGRRWTLRAEALAEAAELRRELEHDGWTLVTG